MDNFYSDISHKEFPESEKVSGNSIRIPLLNYIKKENPDFDEDKYLSISELNYFRERYISDLMVNELEKTVLSSLTSATTLTDKIDIDEKSFLTTGQKVADKVATFGGSWTFIISFLLFIFLWISLNVIWLANKGYDPYPFILLNLILSCIAALQAPVIMMSQNRQEDKDRDRSRKDYMINLKSELEIRILHEKLDHLILHQQQDILEMQKTQIDMLKDVSERFKGKE
jgi:uncharacterized membrane protein